LEKEHAANMDLQKKLNNTADTSTAHKKKEHIIIPRPAGTAGKDWSIQEEMGLSKTIEGHKTYKASIVRQKKMFMTGSLHTTISQCQIHDITPPSQINWEVLWSQVQPKEMATLFDVVSLKKSVVILHPHGLKAREGNPIFKCYQNDWATEELVKQYVKNKWQRGYDQCWLEVPEKYAHLKVNASKRSNMPWWKRAQGAIDAAKKKATTAEKAALKRAAVAHRKRRVVDDESDKQDNGGKDEEEEEDMDTK
jgi:hypothetical protein